MWAHGMDTEGARDPRLESHRLVIARSDCYVRKPDLVLLVSQWMLLKKRERESDFLREKNDAAVKKTAVGSE